MWLSGFFFSAFRSLNLNFSKNDAFCNNILEVVIHPRELFVVTFGQNKRNNYSNISFFMYGSWLVFKTFKLIIKPWVQLSQQLVCILKIFPEKLWKGRLFVVHHTVSTGSGSRNRSLCSALCSHYCMSADSDSFRLLSVKPCTFFLLLI